MGFLEGVIINQLDEEGDSLVARITRTQRKDMMYGIDSENVSNVRVFHEGEEIEPDINVLAGKTVLEFSTDGPGWLGMNYIRENFAKKTSNGWDFYDEWYIPQNVLFVLVLPPFSVIESLNADGLSRNKFKLDDFLILSQRFSGGDLHIDLEYFQDKDTFESSGVPTLDRSNFPNINRLSTEIYDESAGNTREMVIHAVSGIDWASRALTIGTILEAVGL